MAIYLKIDGLTGDVTSGAYKGYMHVQSYSWGFSIPVSGGGGTGANRQTPGKVAMSPLHLTKTQDSTTATLMQKSFAGTPFATANVVVTRMIKGSEVEMCRYDMTDIILQDYQTGGSEGGENPTESLGLNFAGVTISQTSTDASSASKGPVRASWNLAKQEQLIA